MRALLALLLKHRLVLIVAGVLSLAAASTALAQPLVVAQVIDDVGAGRSFGAGVWALAALLGAATVLTGVQQYLLQRVGEGVVLEARLQLIGRLFRLPIREYDLRSAGDLVSRVNSDTTLLRVALIQGAVSAVSGLVTIVGAAVAMGFVDLGLLALTAGIILFSLLVVLGLGMLVRTSSERSQRAVGGLSTALERGLRGIRTIRAANATEREQREVEQHARRAWSAGLAAARIIAIISPVSGLCTQISLLVVLGIGGYRVSTGAMSVADLVTFMLFLVMLVMPLGQAFSAVGSVNQALGAFGRIREILTLPIEGGGSRGTAPAGVDPASSEAVRFAGVSFSYAAGVESVLDEVDFTVRTGSRVAFVGPSGAGKSTIFQLIERFYEPDSGTIALFGSDVAALDHISVRAMIGYVEQDAPALGGTLRGNLLLGAPQADDAAALAALEKVGLTHLARRGPAGLDEQIGDAGATLSGGERQRLAIARALLASPPILLLDESTSSLDSRSELLMRAAFEAVADGRTLLVIAHRLATVIDSDEIFVVDQGRVVGRGTHDELVASSALYRELAQNQLLA